MNKMKKLLSVVLAVVLALSAFSIMGSAAKTSYQTVDNLTALDAYSPYGQVTRLSTEERTSIVFDALDNLLAKTNINMGTVFDVLGLSVTIDLTSIDRLCYSFDTIKDTFNNTLASIAMGIVDLGILESLNVDKWQTGMSRAGTAQFTILSVILDFLSSNTTLIDKLFKDGLDLGMIGGLIGGGLDLSSINNLVTDLPGLVKGLVFPLIERWDDPLSLIKTYDTNSKGNGNVESTVNARVKKLFTDNMSITTVKYDADGNMTSEHEGMPIYTTVPGTPTNDSPRHYFYQNGNSLKVYHIVDAKEAEDRAKDTDPDNDAAAYTYVAQEETYYLEQEVEGSATYVWKAEKTDGMNTWTETLKYYNDDSQLLPGIDGDDFDLATMSAAELLYKFIPTVFKEMAPVVLNGSVKKALAEFVGVDFTYVGQGGPEADDAVMALADSSDAFFTQEQGEYLWEWSDYKVINGNHYYRFEDQIFAGDTSNKNNYFDIINWNFKITDDFMNEFVPTTTDGSDRLLMHTADFLTKVANTVLLPSANTVDTRTDYTATWTRPNFAAGNANIVNNVKALAQAIVGLAPQHIFGDDYATNERCYVELMLSSDNDTVLTGIAAHLVNTIMPSMSLPGKSDIKASGAKVGAILAAVVREFAAYLAPEYNFDALIYTSFENGTKTFVTGKDSEYWFDVILTMGINVGFEYLRAFADMGEGTAEWDAFVAYSGYAPDGKTYAAGMTTAELNAHWEGMVDYIVDWALTTNKEWCWKMGNLFDAGATVDLATAQDPFVKIENILSKILPVSEILTVEPTNGEAKFEHWLREDLILGIVDLKWDHLINTIQFNGSNKYFRTANVLDQLAKLLKGVVNSLLYKAGGNYSLIPAAVTDFDSLANQNNLKEMIKGLVGVLYTGGVTNGVVDTLMPFINFLLGWKTDPQVVKDPVIWTQFRDGNDYAFQWVDNGVYPSMDADNTLIKILNNSSGMLETHRNSDVNDHAYDIQIKSVTSDATVNTLQFNYGDGLISPYETLDIKIGGTYKGEEAATITIAYDYIGKDGKAIGGTQYTSLTILFSNQYEDANISGRFSGDDDKDYTGTDDFGRYQFTEDIYDTVVNYQPRIFYVGSTFSNPDKDLGTIAAPDWEKYKEQVGTDDCGDPVYEERTRYFDLSDASKKYFAFRAEDADAGWKTTMSKGGGDSYGYLYKAANGTTADTEIPYGTYYMGRIAVAYGKDNKQYEITFIHYNDYDIYDIYLENQWNGYNAYQGVDAETYNEYNAAWRDIVKYATYPMMTEDNGNAATDYVKTIQPYIPAAIERFEAAKEAYETALAEAQASGSAAASLPAYVEALQAEIDDDFMNGKEINFQDYNFYEYFNYNDVKVAAEKLYRSYLAPEVMDTYYIMGSGIREAELDDVIDAEANPIIAEGIRASRMMNDQAAIDASQAAHDEWKQPVNTKLIVEDFTSRLAFYKQLLSTANKEANDHMKFLEKEIAFVEAQGLKEADYTADSWENYQAKLAEAKAVAAGSDEFSSFNSRIYDVKYNLMVAYKNLLLKDASLIEAGGTADLLANIETAEAIFASLAAEDGEWALSADYEGAAEDAYAQLISALGYYYEGEDGNTWNLYADSAYEYRDNDRPNNQNGQAKVEKANANLEAAIANFEGGASEPNTLVLNENAPFEAIIDLENTIDGEFTGTVYGFDTLGWNDAMEADGTIADFLSTAYGDDYLEVIEADGGETTGTIINVLDGDGNVVESYVYIYFGDVNGDGLVDNGDSVYMDTYGLMFEGIDDLMQMMASDVNGDGMIDNADSVYTDTYGLMFEGMPTQAEIAEMAVCNFYEFL